MKRNLIVIASIIFIVSCISHKINFNYPSDIVGECNHAKNQSKIKIESYGTSLKEKSGCTLTKHPGQKKFGKMWCWFDTGWQMYVGGLCWGSRIEIGCNPQTGGETMFEVNEHEHAHYWLITNYNDYSHDPKYSNSFYNWREPRFMLSNITPKNFNAAKTIIKSEYDKANEGSWISVNGIDENNERYHIDFIVIKD